MKKVLFHTGRGGRFNNGGYKTAEGIIDNFDADYYGINIYYSFENISRFLEITGLELDKLDVDVWDLAYNWSDENKKIFDDLKIVNIEDSTDEETIYITHKSLGHAVINNESGNKICTVEEYNSDNGSFEIDGDYDTYYWCTFENLNEDDLEIMIRDLSSYDLRSFLIDNGVDDNVFDLAEKTNNLKEYIYTFVNLIKWEDFKNFPEVLEFETEEEASEKSHRDQYIEVDGKYYTID